jgi:hypothetical protein
MALLQKKFILTKESNHKGSHLDSRKKNHLVNLEKSFWPCLAGLGVIFLLVDYWTI